MLCFKQISKIIALITVIFLLLPACDINEDEGPPESNSIKGTWKLLKTVVSGVETFSPFTNSTINWDSGPLNDSIKWTEFLVFTQTSFNDYIYVESFDGDGENGPVEKYCYYYCGSESENYEVIDTSLIVGEWEAKFDLSGNYLRIYLTSEIMAEYYRESDLGITRNEFCSQIIALLDI